MLVVTEVGGDHVVAYYAWCMAQIALATAPARMRKGAGRSPQPWSPDSVYMWTTRARDSEQGSYERLSPREWCMATTTSTVICDCSCC